MRVRKERIVIFALLFLGWCVPDLSSQTKRQSTVIGKIVAYKAASRCPECKGADGSIGIAVENWILRVDSSSVPEIGRVRYILVKYLMYERSLTAKEINKSLQFIVRERFEHEMSQDCIGTVVHREGEETFLRAAEASDFELTKAGKKEGIPNDFKNYPCFIVDALPVTPR